MKDAVILIPSYEPDDLLVNVVKELRDNDFPILVVNDGSGPEFEHVFDMVKDQVTYLSYEKNHGKGYAMKHGYSKIKELFPEAKYIITADGDGQHALKDIIRVYDKLVETDQLVFGVRYFGKDVPFRSKFGNEFSKTSRSLLTKQYIQDDQCGLRGFPVRYLPTLLKTKGNRYEYEMNQIVSFQLMQAPLYTIQIETIYLDNNSRSHFAPFRDTFRIQSIIFAHAIPALLCYALMIFLLIFGLLKIEMPIYGIVHLVYTAVFLIYFLLVNIIYPTKNFFRRFFKDLLFGAIKMETIFGFLLLTVGLFHWHPGVMVPIIVIASGFINVPFSWLFRKMFPSY